MVRSVDVFNVLVEDLYFMEVRVGHEEFVFVVDGLVEWISVRVSINVFVFESSWPVPFIVAFYLFWVVWADDEVELVVGTFFGSGWEEEPSGETVVVIVVVYVEFLFALESTLDGLVQFMVSWVVMGVPVVVGIAFDDVLAILQFVSESVEFDKVQTVPGDVQFTIVFVEFRSNEYSDHGINWFLAGYVQFVGEWFVVQTFLASTNMERFLFEFFFGVVDGVGEVGVENVEVGDQWVEFSAGYFNTWEVKFFVFVRWKVRLVFLEVHDDLLEELVEDWVTKRGFEVFEDRWSKLVFIQRIVRVAKEVTSEELEGSVELGVWRIWVGFDQISQDFKAMFVIKINFLSVFGVNESLVDGIADPSFVILDEGVRPGVFLVVESVALVSVVVFVVQMYVGRPAWEFQTVGVLEGWIVSSFDFVIVVEVWDFSVSFSNTFQVITGQDLLMDVVELFSAVWVLDVEFFGIHPEGIVQVVVVVERVYTNIFSEVREVLFWVQVHVPASVVGVNGVSLVSAAFLVFTMVQLLVFLGFVDDFGWEEVIWVDFVDWWQDETFGVLTVDDGNRQGIYVHAFVDMFTCPPGGLVESFPVLGVVEDLEESDSFLQLIFVEDGEDFSFG